MKKTRSICKIKIKLTKIGIEISSNIIYNVFSQKI